MATIRSHADALAALIDARKELGWSQERLASAIGVRQSTIGNYESGSNRVSVERLIELADALGLEVHLRPRAEVHDLASAAARLADAADPGLRDAATVILAALADKRVAR